MKSVYIYPKTDYTKYQSANPYIHNLEQSLSDYFKIANKDYLKHGSFDMFRHFGSDIFFLNWTEDLPRKNFGLIQFFAFSFFLILTRIFARKIVWVMHNINTHSRKHWFWNQVGFRNMIMFSDLIITHSEGGVDYIKKYWPKYSNKIAYIIHPVDGKPDLGVPGKFDYDILLWGTIYPYKGIVEFLKFAKESPLLSKQRILIAGKCFDDDYRAELISFKSAFIQFRDEFLSIGEITGIAYRSRVVLFTYNSPSVLSSGSLMDTIKMGRPILGPERGAFKDLEKFGLVKTYNSFKDIEKLLLTDFPVPESGFIKKVELFCAENSWESFGHKISALINSSFYTIKEGKS